MSLSMSLRRKYFLTLFSVSVLALVGLVAILGKIVIDDKMIYFRDTQLTQLVRLREVIRDRYEIARLTGANGPRLEDLEFPGDFSHVWIVNASGAIVATSTKSDLGLKISDRLSTASVETIKRQGLAQGSFEGFTNAGARAIVSFGSVPENGLVLISATPLAVLYRVISVFAAQLAGSLVSLLGIAFAASHWLSGSMTKRLKVISGAMSAIQSGDFTARAKIDGGDELTTLAQQLGTMASRLSSLVASQAEKVRTDEELRTAKIVQDNLFPETEQTWKQGIVVGSYSPASEVSGDWWTSFENGGRLFLIVADATGHGVAAALLTSAATAAVGILQDRPALTPAELLRQINLAIFRTSKGQMQMTMFVSAYELATGMLTYANARMSFRSYFRPLRI